MADLNLDAELNFEPNKESIKRSLDEVAKQEKRVEKKFDPEKFATASKRRATGEAIRIATQSLPNMIKPLVRGVSFGLMSSFKKIKIDDVFGDIDIFKVLKKQLADLTSAKRAVLSVQKDEINFIKSKRKEIFSEKLKEFTISKKAHDVLKSERKDKMKDIDVTKQKISFMKSLRQVATAVHGKEKVEKWDIGAEISGFEKKLLDQMLSKVGYMRELKPLAKFTEEKPTMPTGEISPAKLVKAKELAGLKKKEKGLINQLVQAELSGEKIQKGVAAAKGAGAVAKGSKGAGTSGGLMGGIGKIVGGIGSKLGMGGAAGMVAGTAVIGVALGGLAAIMKVLKMGFDKIGMTGVGAIYGARMEILGMKAAFAVADLFGPVFDAIPRILGYILDMIKMFTPILRPILQTIMWIIEFVVYLVSLQWLRDLIQFIADWWDGKEEEKDDIMGGFQVTQYSAWSARGIQGA